jgi:hypothetical protein
MHLLTLKKLCSTRTGGWLLGVYLLYVVFVFFAGNWMWLEGDRLKIAGGPALSAYEIADGFFFRDVGAPLSRLYFMLNIRAAPETSWFLLPLLSILVLVQAYIWVFIANYLLELLIGRKTSQG